MHFFLPYLSSITKLGNGVDNIKQIYRPGGAMYRPIKGHKWQGHHAWRRGSSKSQEWCHWHEWPCIGWHIIIMAPYIMYRKEEELNTKGFLFGEVRPKWAKFKEEGGSNTEFLWMSFMDGPQGYNTELHSFPYEVGYPSCLSYVWNPKNMNSGSFRLKT